MSERLQTDLPEHTDDAGSDPRSDELTVADQRRAERDAREARASGEVAADAPAGQDAESSYPTEREQGAAQPGPDDAPARP